MRFSGLSNHGRQVEATGPSVQPKHPPLGQVGGSPPRYPPPCTASCEGCSLAPATVNDALVWKRHGPAADHRELRIAPTGEALHVVVDLRVLEPEDAEHLLDHGR